MSGPFDPFDLIDHNNPLPTEHPAYTISDLIGQDCASDHDLVKHAMANWLRAKLRPQRGSPPITVSVECGLGPMWRNQLWLKASKAVDIVIHNDIVFVQFEVESNYDRQATIRKLSFGLSDQLRFLNNRGVDITTIVGFYVPIGYGYVERVTYTWMNERLRYKMTPMLLKQQNVWTEIEAVYLRQSVYQLEATHRNLTLPLSPAYVRNTWGSDAYQMTSGGSIVIMCPSEGAVYKYPLRSREIYILLMFYELRINIAHCSLPIGKLTKEDYLVFFKFSAYQRPLGRSETKHFIVPLVEQVVEALGELHAMGWAHQDVRLDNICFHAETGTAVLIDLDRACKVSAPAQDVDRYGDATMYTSPSPTWTAENIDWRQLAIMSHHILSDGKGNYNNIEVSASSSHPYFSTMFTEGNKINEYVAMLSMLLTRLSTSFLQDDTTQT